MPAITCRLTACLTPRRPTTRVGKSLLGDCFQAAACVLWDGSVATAAHVLHASALRAMFARAVDAAEHEVVLPGGAVWSPALDGPLAEHLLLYKVADMILRQRQDTTAAQVDVHRLLERHVYCDEIRVNLQQSYA